jgi:O-antigen/teichoic acid export membrane protein
MGAELAAAILLTRIRPVWPGVRRCLDFGRAAFIFGFNGLVMIAIVRGDLLFLSKIIGEKSFGIFYAGFRLVELVAMLPEAANSSVYPAASREFAKSPIRARDTVELGAALVMAATLPFSLALVLQGPAVLRLMFPPAFAAAASPMAVLALTLIPHVVTMFGGLLLYAAHRQRLAVAVVVANAVAALVLNLVFVPWLGSIGTALARLGWLSLSACWVFILVWRIGIPLRPQRIFATPVLALIPAVLVMLLLPGHPWTAILSATALYLVTLAVIGVAGPAPLRLLPADLLRRRAPRNKPAQ